MQGYQPKRWTASDGLNRGPIRSRLTLMVQDQDSGARDRA